MEKSHIQMLWLIKNQDIMTDGLETRCAHWVKSNIVILCVHVRQNSKKASKIPTSGTHLLYNPSLHGV